MGFDDLRKKYPKPEAVAQQAAEQDAVAKREAQPILDNVIKPVLAQLSETLSDLGAENEVVFDEPIVNPVYPQTGTKQNDLHDQMADAMIRFALPPHAPVVKKQYWPGKIPIVFVRSGNAFKLFAFDYALAAHTNYQACGAVTASTTPEWLERRLQAIVDAILAGSSLINLVLIETIQGHG